MRILFYSRVRNESSVSYLGVHIFEVLNGMSKLGHSISYADGWPFVAVRPVEAEKTSVPLKSGRGMQYLRTGLKKAGIYKAALMISGWTSEISLAITAGKTIVRNRPDVIYRRHVLFNYEYILSRLYKIPCIKEVNSILSDEARSSKRNNFFYLFVLRRLEHISMTRADRLIVVTPKMKEILCRDYKISQNKIDIIENGANTDLFMPLDTIWARNQLKLDQDAKIICFIGALVSWQGIEDLLEAVPRVLKVHPDTYVLIVGDGDMREKLAGLAVQRGIENRVSFIGRVPYEKVPLYINAGDVCVVPKKPLRSGYSPLKLCEYLACCKPVVATRTDGFEFLEEINAGKLVDPQNPQDFANAIAGLLDNPALRKTMGENGRKYVVDNRSWESVAVKTAEICETALRDYRQRRK